MLMVIQARLTEVEGEAVQEIEEQVHHSLLHLLHPLSKVFNNFYISSPVLPHQKNGSIFISRHFLHSTKCRALFKPKAVSRLFALPASSTACRMSDKGFQ